MNNELNIIPLKPERQQILINALGGFQINTIGGKFDPAGLMSLDKIGLTPIEIAALQAQIPEDGTYLIPQKPQEPMPTVNPWKAGTVDINKQREITRKFPELAQKMQNEVRTSSLVSLANADRLRRARNSN